VQAGRTWNEEINAHMEGEGFAATAKGPAMYVKSSWTSGDFAAAGFWVDDCVEIIGSRRELEALATGIDGKYGITGLGEVKWALGMLLERDRSACTISISQEAFTNSILVRFNITDHRRAHCLDAPRTRNSTLRSGLPHLEGRDSGNKSAPIQRAYRGTRVACTQHPARHRIRHQLARSLASVTTRAASTGTPPSA
jgi:Reverse transcriptase (RNA-dependent DNA polymerase)